ncbi:glycosyltransferase [Lacticaseibacillus paracasei]|nr:glycosyltransferase [Lacticaseibacillus paracasei]
MSAFQESPIDIVIPWVDGNDPKWQREKDQYLVAGPHSSRQIGNEDEKKDVRFRDFGLFKYTIMSILRFAPWVNRVFVVTMNQELPFETGSDKVTVIDHRDFIPDPYLPTFNSNSIEMNIHRIPNLAEKFILFNDDCIFNAPVSEEDYFINNIPKDCFGLKPIAPTLGGIGAIESNDVAIINSLVQKNTVIKSNLLNCSLLRTVCFLLLKQFVLFHGDTLLDFKIRIWQCPIYDLSLSNFGT